MSSPTISEKLFEKLCSDRNIECRRIQECTEKTADYEVFLATIKLITEVKQLDFNEEDRKIEQTFWKPNSPGAEAPSDRVQKLIAKAYPQIKKSAKGVKPTMIVVYNNSGAWNWIDSFTISRAMFGLFGISFGLQDGKKIVFTGQGYKGNRKVTSSTLRALSVVGVMKQTNQNAIHLDAYHNPFASIPIETKLLSELAAEQFIHPNPHEKGFVKWGPNIIET
jgi:hypothetical protein